MFHTLLHMVTMVLTGEDVGMIFPLAPFVMVPIGIFCMGVTFLVDYDYSTGRRYFHPTVGATSLTVLWSGVMVAILWVMLANLHSFGV